ncbi:MAG: antitoxin Xre/MbcA/ParS toxin-binding domain-containing protein [Nitrospirota bacterium]
MKTASALRSPEQAQVAGALIRRIRNALALSQESLAGVLGVSVRTVVRWESEGDEPPQIERERLEWVGELVDIARTIMEEDEVGRWFKTPKAALGGRRPVELLGSLRGLQQIQRVLESTRWGIF